ncbi:MAG: 50S ribosomal protein L13 [Clostridia bacterium]|nr:50S ribosomal protein L13 [Clostridia bacterium]
MSKTYIPKLKDTDNKWYLVDAEGKTLGRLASEVASILRGKHKPTFTPHMNMGDHVIVINAQGVVLTGNKLEQKRRHWHTGHPGGVKSVSYKKLMDERPERVIMYAVRGMLPKNKLGSAMLKKLRVYKDAEHPHEAQKPRVLDI